MTTIYAESRFKVSQVDLTTGDFDESRFRVDIDPPVSDSRFEVETVSSGALGLGIPTAAQEGWLTVTHGGTKRRDGLFSQLEIGLSPEGVDWSFANEGFSGDEIGDARTVAWQGTAAVRKAAPPGSDEIDFGFDLEHPGIPGTTVYQVLTGARSWGSDEALVGHEPAKITGSGYLSRFEGIEVDYRKALGTEAYHGEIMIGLLGATGMPSSRIAISPTLGYPLAGLLEVNCGDGVAEARRVAETIGHILTDAADGTVVARHIAPVELSPVATIDIERLETGEVQARFTANTRDVPRCWRVMGSRPEVPEDVEGFVSERRFEGQTVEPFTTPDKYSQAAGGALTLLRASYTENRITSQTWVTETYFQGCLVRRVRETWGQVNPETWRYKTADPATADGTPFTYAVTGAGGGYVFGDDATADDTAPMRAWFEFQLAPVALVQEDFIRSSADTYSGALLQTITSTAEWSTLERAWKVKTSPTNTWDEENVQAGVRFFGGGRPIMGLGSASEAAGFAEELWFKGPSSPAFEAGQTAGMGSVTQAGNDSLPGEPAQMLKISKWATQADLEISPVYIDTGDGRTAGHEASRVTVQEGYAFLEDGDQYQFRNGDVRGTESPEGGVLKTLRAGHTPDSEGSHATTTEERDGKSRFIQATTVAGQPSYLPNLDICNAETQGLGSTVSVRGTVCLNSAAGDFTDRTQKDTFPFGVETDAAAAELATARLRERSALFAELSLPLSAVFYAKAPIKFRALRKGFDPDAYDFPSNAWVDDVRMRVVRDGGSVKKLLVINIRIPII